MNSAQLTSLITKAIVAGSTGFAAWLATKYGISADQWQALIGEVVSIGVTIAATLIAHNFHGNNPPAKS
jgi:hypothetical protein